MPAGCVFCDVVAGRVAAFEVLRDDVAVAFLDKSPLFPGHTLVVPVRHVETLADLAPTRSVRTSSAQGDRAAVPEAFGAAGTFVANNNVVSQSVPHLTCTSCRAREATVCAFLLAAPTVRDGEADVYAERLRRARCRAEPGISISCKCNDLRCIHVVRGV
jgi:histidine triad (HIT) family protein